MTPPRPLARPSPVRGVLFLFTIYAMMAGVGLLWLPVALTTRDGALSACHAWCRGVRWAARVVAGIETEVRGPLPAGDVMIAAKHQSFLDIIVIFSCVPRGRFIMKRELVHAPVLGWYARRIGCIPVDRGRRAQAIRKMLLDVAAGRDAGGQLIIYPQGTRVVPGVAAPYKTGTAALYQELGQACVPAACNVGLFWPRSGVSIRPGRAVVEFLPTIPVGLTSNEFMARLEGAVEPASDRLMAEAGFPPAAVTRSGSP